MPGIPTRRPFPLNAALAAALLSAAGLAALRFLGPGAGPEATAAASLRRPSAAGRAARAPTPASRSPAPGGSRASLFQAPEAEDLSFGDFVDILGLEAERDSIAPVARTFQRDFDAEPALRETVKQFVEAESLGETRTARQFIAALEKRPEFQKLASKYAFQAGSSAALSALLRSPELAAFARAAFSDGGVRARQAIGVQGLGAMRLQSDPRNPNARRTIAITPS